VASIRKQPGGDERGQIGVKSFLHAIGKLGLKYAVEHLDGLFLMGLNAKIKEIILALGFYLLRGLFVGGLDHPDFAFFFQLDRLQLFFVAVLVRQIGRDGRRVAGADLAVDLDLGRTLPCDRLKINRKLLQLIGIETLDRGF